MFKGPFFSLIPSPKYKDGNVDNFITTPYSCSLLLVVITNLLPCLIYTFNLREERSVWAHSLREHSHGKDGMGAEAARFVETGGPPQVRASRFLALPGKQMEWSQRQSQALAFRGPSS